MRKTISGALLAGSIMMAAVVPAMTAPASATRLASSARTTDSIRQPAATSLAGTWHVKTNLKDPGKRIKVKLHFIKGSNIALKGPGGYVGVLEGDYFTIGRNVKNNKKETWGCVGKINKAHTKLSKGTIGVATGKVGKCSATH